jgi:CIC family chloride channel protein
MVFFFLIMMLKPLSTGICVNSGGEGGYFAPSIITGGFLGFFFYKAASLLFPFMALNAVTYIFLGMSATFACVMNAPVTAIFLIAEITQSYQLFVPLMLVCAVSYFLKYYMENLRTGVEQPKGQGKSFRVDKILLNQLTIKQLVEQDYAPVHEHDPFRKVVELFSDSHRDILQVLDDSGKLIGIISLNDIRKKLYDTQHYDSVFAADVMELPEVTVDINEPASLVLDKFDENNVWYLPVVRNGIFMGFISKNKLLTQYRNELTRSNRFF